ncbi:MAG TPA: phospholipid carrier-dependent glycosyltransferase [Streptosporangiaceae bacterium]|nr:phospholipid carrier-dependent glycosyltransferase [Streptosporangiaceae bacterium]
MSGTTPSGTIASPGSGEPRGDSAVASPLSRAGLTSPVGLIIAAAALLALALRLYQLSRPGFLLSVNEYDDGPYFGSAVRLVNGALPYKDFLIVQPPGITLLMLPVALVSKATGTAWGMAIGRILTALAGAVAVALAGLLVRHRGALATIIACGLMAVYPDSIQAAKTVLVEPWLVLFCLIGALAVFDGDHFTTSRRRLIWGGVAFGFGGAVEPWAIFPVLVVAALALPRPRRLLAYAGGVAAGFLVPVVPFAALAPKQFYDATIVAQIGSRPDATRAALWIRLADMTGLADVKRPSHLLILAVTLLIIAIVAGSVGLSFLLTWRPPPVLDWFALGSGGLVLLAFFWSDQFHYHFAAFLAPFLALSIALPVSALVRDIRLAFGGDPAAAGPGGAGGVGGATPPVLLWGATFLAGLAVLIMAFVQFSWETNNAPHLKLSVVTHAQRLIPPGSCLLADEVSFAVMANRLVSDVPGCSLLLDATGTNYAYSHGRDPETGAARYARVDAVWTYAFDHAQYVWLSGLNNHRVAWTPQLRAYFQSHFTQILSAGNAGHLYRRDGLKPAG